MDNLAESCLSTLDNDVRNTELAAEGWQEDDELNRVNVIGNGDELSLLGLDQGGDVVETVLDVDWLWSSLGVGLLAVSDLLGSSIETSLLLLLGLWSVLVQELEHVGGGVLVDCVAELSNCRWDLESLVEDDLLALETDVLWPLDESGQVTRWLDVLADTE